MMKPISTFGQTALRNSQLRRMENELATASQEIATQKKSDVAKSLGSQLYSLQTVRNQFSENNATLRSIDLFEQRTSMMSRALDEVNDAVESLSQLITINAADPLDSAPAVASAAANTLDRIFTALNIDIGGRKLFSGENIDKAPIRAVNDDNGGGAGDLSPAQVLRDVLGAVDGVDVGRALPAPAALRAVDFLANPPADITEAEELLARFDDVFQGNNAGDPALEAWSFEENFFDGSLFGNLTDIRLPGGITQQQSMDQFTDGLRDVLQAVFTLTSVPMTEIADEDTYQAIMIGAAVPEPEEIYAINNGGTPDPTKKSYGFNFSGGPDASVVSRLSSGLTKLRQTHVELGQNQQVIDASRQAVESQNALFNNEIVKMENADVFETQSRFLNIEKQLEASYAATGRIMKLNLWNFVR